MTVVPLVTVIVILLLPGGVPFLIRLCSATLIMLGLAIAYALWSSAALWAIGGLAAIVAGAFVYALVTGLSRPRKRFLSGGH